MVTTSMPPAAPGKRIAAIDALRGVSLIGMIVYHGAWDLSFLGLVDMQPGIDPAWRWFAHIVAGTFLALVGVSLVLATRDGLRLRPYLKRLLAIIIGAALVQTATWWFMSDAYIFFGILHAIAASSVLALPFLVLPVWLVAAAAALCLALPALSQGFCLPGLGCTAFQHPFGLAFLDRPGWYWLGLGPPPSSLDYVPLAPWFALPLAGIVAARLVLARWPAASLAGWRPRARPARTLTFAGRHSLAVYLIHQPILLALFFPLAWLLGADPGIPRQDLEACVADCQASGLGEAACHSYCSCVIPRWSSVPGTGTGEMSDAQHQLVLECLAQSDQRAKEGGEPTP